MKRLALLAALAALIPSLASAMPIKEADTLTGTSVTDRFISGKLDSRLDELGIDKANNQKMPVWFWTQKDGIRLHCSRVLQSRGTFNAKCGAAISTHITR
jgi:hypothetical protein